jgi:predicted GIY-YIG superfamily endonuclease
MLVKIKCENEEDVLKDGVYKIINKANGKYYVGSTIDTFIKRLNHHYHALLRGTHKNSHLQNA